MKTQDGMTWQDFTDGRRPYRRADYAQLPNERNRRFPSMKQAASTMAGCPIAFRVSCTDAGPWSVSVLSEYVLAARRCRGAPWSKTGKTTLATCQADADESLGYPDGTLAAAFNADEFWQIEAKQHLKALKIKTA